MIYTLEITEVAKADFSNSFYWYEGERLGLGEDFELCLEAALASITRYPKHCAVKYGNVRIKFIERFAFGIHFTIERSFVKVWGIYHTSRDPENWYERK